MKYLLSFSLIAAILLQTLSKSAVLFGYEINKEYISKNLCENKNRPMMHCNGQCHLKKQLDKQEKEQSTPMGSIKDNTATVYFFQAQEPDIFSLTQLTATYFHFEEQRTIGFPSSVFHPPSC